MNKYTITTADVYSVGQQTVRYTGNDLELDANPRVPYVAKVKLKYNNTEEVFDFHFRTYKNVSADDLFNTVIELAYAGNLIDYKERSFKKLPKEFELYVLSIDSEFERDLNEIINEGENEK